MRVSFNGAGWRLKGHWPYEPLKVMQAAPRTMDKFRGVTPEIPASVPGSVHRDLLAAGLISDPWRDDDSRLCEWVENRWWEYRLDFEADPAWADRYVDLVFKGVDYTAHFYLNNEPLGRHEGMFDPIRFDITDRIDYDAPNTLVVILENAPPEMSQIGYTSLTHTQKSRFNYKWDFGTRLVHLGIWDDVYLDVTGPARLEDLSVTSDVQNGAGLIDVRAAIRRRDGRPARLAMTLSDGGEPIHWFETPLEASPPETAGELARVERRFCLNRPKLWWPNGLGGQPLYDLTITLREGDTVSDERRLRVGVRQLRFAANDGAPADALPYTVVVNERKVWLRGVNLVPLDHMYGAVGPDDYRRLGDRLRHLNVNLVRVWGGGLIEKEALYDVCDAQGILIWQEFIQSSSGMESEPAKDSAFLDLLRRSARAALVEKRNHVCLSFWSGGNELTGEGNRGPVTLQDQNIAMLATQCAELDPGRLFLPSSPSGPRSFLGVGADDRGRNHDVHGAWRHYGAVRHYAHYGASDSLLHSEFGVEGCSSVRALRRFLSPERLSPRAMKDDLVWRHHGEWWEPIDRVAEFFGDEASLTRFCRESQWIQADGLRFICEANRRRKFHNSGSIIWAFNEPWPNVASNTLIDYYGRPKHAFYAVRDAYAARHVSLDHRRLVCAPGETFEADVWVHNALGEAGGVARWEARDTRGVILAGENVSFEVASAAARRAAQIRLTVPDPDDGVFFIRLRATWNGGGEQENVYAFSTRAQRPFAPLLAAGDAAALVAEFTAEGEDRVRWRVRNTGARVATAIHPDDARETAFAWCDRAFFTLFPGEQATVAARLERRPDATPGAEPAWEWLAL